MTSSQVNVSETPPMSASDLGRFKRREWFIVASLKL